MHKVFIIGTFPELFSAFIFYFGVKMHVDPSSFSLLSMNVISFFKKCFSVIPSASCCHELWILPEAFTLVFIYLENPSQRKEISSIQWFSPQRTITARAEPGPKQEPGITSGSPHRKSRLPNTWAIFCFPWSTSRELDGKQRNQNIRNIWPRCGFTH